MLKHVKHFTNTQGGNIMEINGTLGKYLTVEPSQCQSSVRKGACSGGNGHEFNCSHLHCWGGDVKMADNGDMLVVVTCTK